MYATFRTSNKDYKLKVDKFVCNKFGISEFLISTLNNKSFKGSNVLDVGCGVGPLGIYFADQYNANVTGIELNETACSCCRENIKKLKLLNNFNLINEDFSLYYKNHTKNKFDLIVSNPPLGDPDSLHLKKKYCDVSLKVISDSDAFAYLTNSWYSSSGKDLLDYIFLFAENSLKQDGAIIIAFCSLSNTSPEILKNRGRFHGFSSELKKAIITSECIGVNKYKPELISAYCMTFKKDIICK